MTREIKFRGLRKAGYWLCGNLVVTHDGSFIITSFSDNNFFQAGVRPETVGQFTGLKDKHGVEIYEGDVVSNGSPFEERAQIVWRDYGFEFTWSKERTGSMPLTCIGECEVVGNIYENPELLNPSATPNVTPAADAPGDSTQETLLTQHLSKTEQAVQDLPHGAEVSYEIAEEKVN